MIKFKKTFNSFYNAYLQGARQRNLSFELSRDQFRCLTAGRCHYCGDSPSWMIHDTGRGEHPILRGPVYAANGLDRIDSSRGYTVDNCAPCCTLCNQMKHALTLNCFLRHIAKIHHHHIRQTAIRARAERTP